MAQRHNPDDFNPTTQASEYNAAARRQEVKNWLHEQHQNGGTSGLDKASRGIELDANRR